MMVQFSYLTQLSDCWMSVRLKGGLGIRQMNQVNEALLDAWRDSVSTESYWAKICSSKYKHNNQDRSCINLTRNLKNSKKSDKFSNKQREKQTEPLTLIKGSPMIKIKRTHTTTSKLHH